MYQRVALVSLIVLLSACSEQTDNDGGHVWQEQTEMLDKAGQVEQLIGDAAVEQRQHIEEASQ